MGFFETLEHIRKKPEAERYRLLLVIVGGAMVLVVAIWASTLDFSEKPAAESAPPPWEVLKKTFGAGLKDIKNSLGGNYFQKEN